MAQCHFTLKDYKTAIKDIEKAFEIICTENDKNATSISEEDPFIPYEYLYLLEILVQCYEESRDFYFDMYYPLKFESSQKNVCVSELVFKFHEAPRNALIEKLSKKERKAEKK